MKKRISLVAAAAALAIVGLQMLLILSPSASGASHSAYTETRSLTGASLASELGLAPKQYVGGEPDEYFKTCDGILVEVGDNTAFCTAEATTDPLEAWDISQRLRGHTPTDLEMQAQALSLEADELDEAGKHEEAREIYNQAADLLEADASTPS